VLVEVRHAHPTKEQPMTVTLDRPISTRTRNPKELLNAVQPRIKHLTINVLDGGMPLCDAYNEGRYKHHAPFIERRRDGLCLRSADFLTSMGFDIDLELWAIDGTDCSPCDNKVPDSH
jgi:hypothetical protein